MSAQSVSLECHHWRRAPPIRSPPPRWNQNADGLSLPEPIPRYASPTRRVTTFDQSPPPETKSVTKYQATKTVIAEMNGKRKRRVSSKQAASTSSRSESRATENPWKGESNDELESHPNQTQSAPMKAPQAITEENANTPAAIHRP